MRYVRHGRGWYVYGIRTALQGRSKASCPAPLVRAARRRLTHVSRTYSTEAPGRTCKLREGPAAHEGGEAGDEHEPAARQHVLQPLALAKRPVLGTDRRCRAANTRRRRPVVLLAAAWHVGVLRDRATCCVRVLVATGLENGREQALHSKLMVSRHKSGSNTPRGPQD